MADSPKHVQLTDDLHRYLVEHGTPPDDVLADLIDVTEREVGDFARMQIAPEQGAFLTFLVRSIGATRAIEIGTFTGYSGLCIARGLPEHGNLLCLDVSEEWTSIGREHWERAGLRGRIELRIAPALDSLASLPAEPTFDFAFVDADKNNYLNYLEALVPRMTAHGVIAVDNVLWGGRVIDPGATDPDTEAIRAFNDAVVADERFDTVMLPLADGVTLLRLR